eukprot:47589-Eustigmatos_ZCMA.PRE.1
MTAATTPPSRTHCCVSWSSRTQRVRTVVRRGLTGDSSGIHRSLGVHISKVRSLVLDQIDPVDLGVLRRLGNQRVKELWEHKLLDGWSKPTANDSRQ